MTDQSQTTADYSDVVTQRLTETQAAILLAISEVHAGSRDEGDRISKAVLGAIIHGDIPGVSYRWLSVARY